jgi:hypothetical protein
MRSRPDGQQHTKQDLATFESASPSTNPGINTSELM